MSQKVIYKISFLNQDSIYEIYARSVTESDMFGFLKVEEIVFGENTSLVVDPAEERLKMEFQGVKRTYIPAHSIIRIDEVKKEGIAKVRDKGNYESKISPFPGADRQL